MSLDTREAVSTVATAAWRRKLVPYGLLLPGGLWLIVFFVVPMLRLVSVSLQTGIFPRYRFSWEWSNYAQLFTNYSGQAVNSLVYALLATAIAFLIAYPLAYFIAFRGGRWKNFLLVMLLMPFLMPFLLRTLSWKIILADNGVLVEALKSLHLLSEDGRLLATGVGGGGRHRLQLPGLHDPADLCVVGEDRPVSGRSCQRPVCQPGGGLPQGHLSAVAARRGRRHAADVHSCGRRLRQRGVARAHHSSS